MERRDADLLMGQIKGLKTGLIREQGGETAPGATAGITVAELGVAFGGIPKVDTGGVGVAIAGSGGPMPSVR